jgi:PhnB protein
MYLTFAGNCEEAMDYYKDIFDGKYTVTMRYSEGPPEYSNNTIANKIMHQTLVFANGCELKASDSFHEPLNKGNNFHVSISTDDEEESIAIFNGLSDNGTTTMPFNDVFWGGKFGSCIDQFGVQWMVSLDTENA